MAFPRYTRMCVPLIWLAAVISCDTFTEDTPAPAATKTDYYITPGSAVIIDVGSIVSKSFATGPIRIAKQPYRGTITQVNSELMKYSPDFTFSQGTDQFIITQEDEGSVLDTYTIVVTLKPTAASFPCKLMAVEDRISLNADGAGSVLVGVNDRVCGVPPGSVTVSIATTPLYGQATVDGLNVNYVKAAGFNGTDEFIYKLTSTAGVVSYGLISIGKWAGTHLVPPPGILISMEFIDENIGFLAGEGIYKTIDGGKTWSQVFAPEGSMDRAFVDMHFTSEKDGIAIYSCFWDPAWGCESGLAITHDGGETWRESGWNDTMVYTSVFFTSPAKGFISRYPIWSHADEVAKTEDGGRTWDVVWSGTGNSYGSPLSNLQFSNGNVGHVFQPLRVISTKDGGSNWQATNSFASGYISAAAVYAEDTVLIGHAGSDGLASTTVSRYIGGVGQEIAHFPYTILDIEFSSSRRTGFSIGLTSKGIALHEITGKGEVWKDLGAFPFANKGDSGWYGPPSTLSMPSDEVVYILFGKSLIKFFRN